MAHDIARALISKLTKTTSGPEYEEAVQTGAAYWLQVLQGQDSQATKQAHDVAMSRLLGCTAHIEGRRLGLKEKIEKDLRENFWKSLESFLL